MITNNNIVAVELPSSTSIEEKNNKLRINNYKIINYMTTALEITSIE